MNAPISRKGARSTSTIDRKVLLGLNNGTLATASLSEGLAVDFRKLLKAVAPELPAKAVARVQPGDGVTTRMATAGVVLLEHYGLPAFDRFCTHTSDTVRGWAAYMVAAAPELSLDKRLTMIRPLADDPHFGVREWAWLALRPRIAAEIIVAIELLKPWTAERSERLRRFAVESTRPRGVWCRHIAELRERPELALPLLEPVREDPTKYVQDSVSNWLNDAAKSQPEWVRKLCQRWLRNSQSPATERICKRALRNLTE